MGNTTAAMLRLSWMDSSAQNIASLKVSITTPINMNKVWKYKHSGAKAMDITFDEPTIYGFPVLASLDIHIQAKP